MKTYLMLCLKRAVSQSRLSTSLTMRKDPTQVSWTVETVPGKSLHVIMCINMYMSPFLWSIHTLDGL